MKKLTLILGLLFMGGLALGLRAQPISPEGFNNIASGTDAVTSDTVTYALNQSLTGTVSAYIDLRTVSGLMVSVSGTATGVHVEWNSLSTSASATTWFLGQTLPMGHHQPVKKQGNYVRFKVNPNSAAGTKATLWYSIYSVAGVGSGTPESISGPVRVFDESGAPFTEANPLPVSGPARLLDENGAPYTDANALPVSGPARLFDQNGAPFSPTNPLPVAVGGAPTNLVSITLTGSTSWTNTPVTCTAQPCNILFWNESPTEVLFWWHDRTTTSPVFGGISMTAGTVPIKVPVAPGDVFHYRYSASTGNGYLQNRH